MLLFRAVYIGYWLRCIYMKSLNVLVHLLTLLILSANFLHFFLLLSFFTFSLHIFLHFTFLSSSFILSAKLFTFLSSHLLYLMIVNSANLMIFHDSSL